MARRPPVSDARPALRARRRQGRRRRLKTVLVLVLVLAVLGGLGYLVGWSSVLAVRSVRVEGTAVLTPERVREAAAVPSGRPLVRLDTDAIAARVAALAPVESVEVHRRVPDTVVLAVTERTPVLATARDGRWALVDRAGVAFTTVAEVPDGVVPAVLGEEVAPEQRERLLVDLATVVRACPPELLEQVRSVSASSADTLTLRLTDDRRLDWGSAEDSPLKAEVATVLLRQEGEVYNVAVPSHPTVR
ncbi:cell division protein FtsQ/DivIB [Desertihabitans aurantiacus]|uniref:cell division protein FtsQ/DivIB n=1 Tax=Desertihabitans aurantiacus TaxID=2282477 RepID=UPI000DF73239|nr:FtsQ-type POTRA domain-containing protein [Desertihabitans aurantiacus]